MGKYEGFLLCADFDGTFALPGAALSAENLDAVKRFQDGGGLFTIASGRPIPFIRELTRSFEVNAPIIALNGTVVCDPDTFAPLHEHPMGEDVLPVLDQAARRGFCGRMALWNATELHNRWTEDDGVLPGEYFARLPRPWYKAVLVQDDAATLALRDWFHLCWGDRFTGSRSWPQGFEIQALGAGKGAALRWIREYLGSRVHTAVGAGDFENDISLIRDADIGYAVANALPEVRAAADRVTVANTGHAIAAIIADLTRARA